ncbi:hypothetical protein OAG47_01475 [Verrucomicrobiales bacterium]|jgi:hypothetical protein|nr:hypothetical protein [Verrucomicrobiales bacterium]
MKTNHISFYWKSLTVAAGLLTIGTASAGDPVLPGILNPDLLNPDLLNPGGGSGILIPVEFPADSKVTVDPLNRKVTARFDVANGSTEEEPQLQLSENLRSWSNAAVTRHERPIMLNHTRVILEAPIAADLEQVFARLRKPSGPLIPFDPTIPIFPIPELPPIVVLPDPFPQPEPVPVPFPTPFPIPFPPFPIPIDPIDPPLDPIFPVDPIQPIDPIGPVVIPEIGGGIIIPGDPVEPVQPEEPVLPEIPTLDIPRLGGILIGL